MKSADKPGLPVNLLAGTRSCRPDRLD